MIANWTAVMRVIPGEGERFAGGCFDDRIGDEVPVDTPSGRGSGHLLAVEVAADGSWADLKVEIRRGAAMRSILLGCLLLLAACGSGPAVPQPAETPQQHYWSCWNSGSTLERQYGWQPHPSTSNLAEHWCLDSELRASGFVEDAKATSTAGWRPK